MQLLELFDEIESPRFSAQLSVVSGFSVLQLALRDSDTLKQLIDVLQGSAHNQQKTFEQLVMLLSDNPNPNSMHVHDEAITAYLYVLSLVDTQSTQSAIALILQTTNLWWARRLANHIQETRKTSATQVTCSMVGDSYSSMIDWTDSMIIVSVQPSVVGWPVQGKEVMQNTTGGTITYPERRRYSQ